MNKVRLADIPDMDEICLIASEFRSKEGCIYANIKPDEQKFRLFVAGLMGIKKGIVIVAVDNNDKPQGFLLGIVEEFFWSKEQMATDMLFCVREDHLSLAPFIVKRFIGWAESKPKVSRIILGVSSGIWDSVRTGKMYQSLGLQETGGIFVKSIKRTKSCHQSQ